MVSVDVKPKVSCTGDLQPYGVSRAYCDTEKNPLMLIFTDTTMETFINGSDFYHKSVS